MIEMDDAGSGCPILGEVFVARRVETGEFKYFHILRGTDWSKEKMLSDLLQQLQLQEGEVVSLCRGNTFDYFAKKLVKQGIKVERCKVGEETDVLAERVFLEELRKVGLPQTIVLDNRKYGEFYKKVKVWYMACYNGERNLLKKQPHRRKWKTRDYTINSIYKYPNLIGYLFS